MNTAGGILLDPSHVIAMSIPTATLVLFGVALALSAIGFARFVYFISVGYGLSVAGIAFFSFVYYRSSGNLGALLHMMLILIYGFRLATYLMMRDRKPSYQAERRESEQRYDRVSVGLKFLIWISVSLLYVAMVSPVLFHFSSLYALTHSEMSQGVRSLAPRMGGATASALVIAGLAVGYCGLILEWVADRQKSRRKRRDTTSFCNVGLYRMVRYPNYFGEITLWLGSWVAGIPFYTSWFAWVLSSIGLAVIILIMLGSAKRLEEKHERRYGDSSAYKEYTRSVPILFPLVPVYSFKKLKVYLG